MARKTNVPIAALRWSVERAGIEFGMSSATLRKSLAKNSAVPDRDGLFSTAQLVAAIYGGLYLERLRTQRARAQQLELQNAITTGEVLNRAELSKAFAAIADAVVSRIMSSGLARSEKEDILRDISTWPSALKGVAERQTRLQRNNTGHAANTADENGNGENGSDYDRPRTATTYRRKSTPREERG